MTQLTSNQIDDFHRDGYLLMRHHIAEDLMQQLLAYAKADPAFQQTAEENASDGSAQSTDIKSRSLKDAEGGSSRLYIEHALSESDPYAAFARLESIVSPMSQLLGRPVLYFQHKMMLKEPRVGGAWEWHQDYGYWYEHRHFMLPSMASALIAVDRATRENGCLQVIRGSHKLGRINHQITGTQTGTDPRRVEAALDKMELVYCELEPGDVLFFHGNTLHRSDQNRSEHPRWSLISCYSTDDNFVCEGDADEHLLPIEPLSPEAVAASFAAVSA